MILVLERSQATQNGASEHANTRETAPLIKGTCPMPWSYIVLTQYFLTNAPDIYFGVLGSSLIRKFSQFLRPS